MVSQLSMSLLNALPYNPLLLYTFQMMTSTGSNFAKQTKSLSMLTILVQLDIKFGGCSNSTT